MGKEKIHEILHPAKFKEWIKFAFKEANISSISELNDDKKIEKAAKIAYKKIPRFPYRTIIKTTVGEKGFLKLVFGIRDKMLEAKSLNFSLVNTEYLKLFLSNLKK